MPPTPGSPPPGPPPDDEALEKSSPVARPDVLDLRLLTGDLVKVTRGPDGKDRYAVVSARPKGSFRFVTRGEDTYIIPKDVDLSRFNIALFNVSYLVREEYYKLPVLPVIIQTRPGFDHLVFPAGHLKVFEEGTLVEERDIGTVFSLFRGFAGSPKFRLEFAADNPMLSLSTHTETKVEFKADPNGDSTPPWAGIVAVGQDLFNKMPGGEVSVVLKVAESISAIPSLEYSTDDGQTWRTTSFWAFNSDKTMWRTGLGFHTNTQVSLRYRTTDDAGNTFEHTVIKAFSVTEVPAVPPALIPALSLVSLVALGVALSLAFIWALRFRNRVVIRRR